MYRLPEWGQRKREIALAFYGSAHLPDVADAAVYADLLERIGVSSLQDMCILISIVQDLIMMARREGQPSKPLETFLDWLERSRIGEELEGM